jgi:predicted transcriptional regulator
MPTGLKAAPLQCIVNFVLLSWFSSKTCSRPMYSYSNSRVSIELDATLVDWVDQLIAEASERSTSLAPELMEQKRSQAIEEAIQLWCQQKANQRLQQAADLHRQRHNQDETGWLV